MPLTFKRTRAFICIDQKPTLLASKKVKKSLGTVTTARHSTVSVQRDSEELIRAIQKLPFSDLLSAHFHLLARAMDIRAFVSSSYFFPRTVEDIIEYMANPSVTLAIKNLLHKLDYTSLRPIQLACFEPILHRSSCIFVSRTAAGKTFAYLLPLLLREGFLNTARAAFSQILVICPTRILCEQVATVTRTCLAALLEFCPRLKFFTVCSVYSGQSQSLVNTSLELANMLVATPGILISRQYTFTGSTVVLDEYDDLLGGSFLDDVKQILKITDEPCSVPTSTFTNLIKGIQIMSTSSKTIPMAQFICVSATMTDEALAQAEFLAFSLSSSTPNLIIHGSLNKIPPNIQHAYLLSSQADTSAAAKEKSISKSSKVTFSSRITSIWHLKQLLEDREIKSEGELIDIVSSGSFYSKCIVFFLLRSQVEENSRKEQQGKTIFRLHGEMQQEIRDEILTRFSEAPSYSGAVLFTTDLGARGLDSKDVDLVISIGFPPTTVSFIHRVGRAGRMGQKSLAVTVVSNRADLLRQIDDCFETSVLE
ncbi:ATP-dependent RNA helicase [Giardia lamblia P15]|uniref:ATP-dependent RNA helicase n=1 Tax=Giardia intestinalis (strain P15) TaxID=658858 RepID=E1F9Q9_GIAIA|nr:ATP-dependent RNA helicase [Giardia lamblia P15]